MKKIFDIQSLMKASALCIFLLPFYILYNYKSPGSMAVAFALWALILMAGHIFFNENE